MKEDEGRKRTELGLVYSSLGEVNLHCYDPNIICLRVTRHSWSFSELSKVEKEKVMVRDEDRTHQDEVDDEH